MIEKYIGKSSGKIEQMESEIIKNEISNILQKNLSFIYKFLTNLGEIFLLITDKDLIIKYANKSFLKFANLENVEEKNLRIFLPPYVKFIPIPEEGQIEKIILHLKCRKPDVNLSVSGYVSAQGDFLIFFLEKRSYNYHELYEKISELNNEITRLTRESHKKEHLVENLKLELKETIRKDILTDAYNRVYLKEVLDREIGRVKRYKVPLSVVLVDIENFKSINQNYGRTTGDKILKQFSKLLIGSTRMVDMVFRYEEDNFIIMLPNTNIDGAKIVAKKIEKKVDSTLFEQNISISIRSIPIQCEENDTNESLINRAFSLLE